jgi:hypothetical protein
MTTALTLLALPGRYAVCRLPADADWPAWPAGEFISISRTQEELSVVCREEAVPPKVRHEGGWRCLRVAGTLDFSAIGVLAALAAPLAEAGVSILAIATFDTDYVLIKEADYDRACLALRERGHQLVLGQS